MRFSLTPPPEPEIIDSTEEECRGAYAFLRKDLSRVVDEMKRTSPRHFPHGGVYLTY